jgi:hypothetical protein
MRRFSPHDTPSGVAITAEVPRERPANGRGACIGLGRVADLLPRESVGHVLRQCVIDVPERFGRGMGVSFGLDSRLLGSVPPGKEGGDRGCRGGEAKAYRCELGGHARMPGPRLKHLRCGLEELGDRNEQACNGESEITSGRATSSSCDEANEGGHVGPGEEEREGHTQMEFERDVEKEVVDQVYG